MQTLQNKYLFFWSHSERGSNVTKACLSQWYPSYMIIDNVPYCNVEQYLMAEKARTFGDTETEQKILKTSDPKEIKELGREVKDYDDQIWAAKRKDVAFKANTVKFASHTHLRKFLFETKIWTLVEASPYDRIWGIGYNEAHALKVSPDQWGQNLLGQVLMEVRANLKKPYLKYCRYYKDDGSSQLNRPGDNTSFASYEFAWIVDEIANPLSISSLLSEYFAYGHEFFNMNDGVPITLKATLFNRWAKMSGFQIDKDGFQTWYKEHYLKTIR